MASRPLLRRLMTGAALASLSTAAMADGWNGMIVFGGRNYDSGQYVSPEAIFTDGTPIGDGRNRATNRVTEGGRAQVISQRVADSYDLGSINPSQPQTYRGVSTPPDGYNYAAIHFDASEIRESIDGATTTTSRIDYGDEGNGRVVVEGRSRSGFLNDPERNGDAWGALVLVEGGTLDIRNTANIVKTIDGDINLQRSMIYLSALDRDDSVRDAADEIGDGVAALADAGAGLLVVSNAYDVASTPETAGDNGLLEQADDELRAREEEARASEERALAARLEAEAAAQALSFALAERERVAADYETVHDDPDATEQDRENAARDLEVARQAVIDSDAEAIASAEAAVEARTEADDLALTTNERALRPEIDAALDDPTLIERNRTAATDAYNAQLIERLRGINGNLVVIDQHALFEAVIADPARFGLSADYNQANDCVESNELHPCNDTGGNARELLFQNGVDLTEAGHALVADQIVALINAPDAIAGVPAVSLSAARSVSDAARDQLSREQTTTPGLAPFLAGTASRVKLSPSDGFVQQDASYRSGVAGLKYVVGNGIAVGAAAGYHRITSPGDKSAMDHDGHALVGTLFAGVNSGPVFGNVTATWGKIDYDALTRVSKIGAARIRNSAEAEGSVHGVTAEAGLHLMQYDVIRAGPIARFSHWKSRIDGYSENGWEATAVRTGDVETSSTRAGIGMFLEAGNFSHGEGSMFRVKALYGHEFGDDSRTASVTPLGPNSAGSFSTHVRGIDDAPLEFGAEVVFGFRGLHTTFAYDGLFGDYSDHRFRVGASVPLGG